MYAIMTLPPSSHVLLKQILDTSQTIQSLILGSSEIFNSFLPLTPVHIKAARKADKYLGRKTFINKKLIDEVK